MALLVLTTGLVAAGQTPMGVNPASHEGSDVVAQAGQGDFALAMLSIFLGGGMFYLFRPIRRVPVEVHA
ncbi:MAG: hypothetical protein JXA11_16010 [Phycisphaerae bacterium]|nr:hypothetical protein [Phycisphaerae bacterium]